MKVKDDILRLLVEKMEDLSQSSFHAVELFNW